MILGMDWLSEHKAKVDIEMKLITLRNSDGLEIFVVGERPRLMSNVASTMKAEKMIGKGCEPYLAYMINSVSKDLRVQDILTVKDSPNVFPEKLSGLPPDMKLRLVLSSIMVLHSAYCDL